MTIPDARTVTSPDHSHGPWMGPSQCRPSTTKVLNAMRFGFPAADAAAGRASACATQISAHPTSALLAASLLRPANRINAHPASALLAAPLLRPADETGAHRASDFLMACLPQPTDRGIHLLPHP